MSRKSIVVIAEFSIHPIGSGASVGKYVKAAVKAISSVPGLNYQVTPMATVLEARDIATILRAVEISHKTLRSMGAKRVSSLLRIDDRLDKPRTMKDKIRGLSRSVSS
jgi:uncharacterized protein (TIGR00106 family)